LALAYHGAQIGVPVTVMMPTIAPLTKVANCRDLGANVMVQGEHLGEAREMAMELAAERGMRYINGYDDPAVIAGAGTVGLELLEQVPDVEAVVVPVGGGGLIAGMALAIKTLRPDVQVIGVEPNNVASMQAALAAGEPVHEMKGGSLADGLAVPVVGTNAFHITRDFVDKVVGVRERNIALAMLRLVEGEKSVVEGGGASGLAALLEAGCLPELHGKTVAVPLCGGNVDMTVLGRVIDRGLAADGRLSRFAVTVSDRPGGIAQLTAALAETGASIKEIFHERAWVDTDMYVVHVKCVIELRGHDHWYDMAEHMASKGFDIERY
jgi:threonine dehydratase